ncbi:hypothetical protein [Aeromonas veronii]|uniref:hypothetical protein n=1 Tax=Aeromonas veronii TaxID=654 RepID=UPI003BA2C7A7
MIDFTDYHTYLYGFTMLAFLYFDYQGAYVRQAQYKLEHRYNKNKAIVGFIIFSIMVGIVYCVSPASIGFAQGHDPVSIVNINVLLAFWYLDGIASITGAYRGAKKLNEDDAQ